MKLIYWLCKCEWTNNFEYNIIRTDCPVDSWDFKKSQIIAQQSFKISYVQVEIVKIEKMSKILKIGFLGGGKIAQAMAKGFIASGQL